MLLYYKTGHFARFGTRFIKRHFSEGVLLAVLVLVAQLFTLGFGSLTGCQYVVARAETAGRGQALTQEAPTDDQGNPTGSATTDGVIGDDITPPKTTRGLVANEEEKQCLSLHENEQVNLVSEIVSIPIKVVNTCKSEKVVQVVAISDDTSRFDVQEEERGALDSITLKANSENVIEIPVRARANGDFKLTVTVASSDEGKTIEIAVHSMRDIGSVLLVLFIVVVLFLLTFGTLHTVKRYKNGGKRVDDE